MLLLLAVLLFSLTMISFYFSGRDILSPTFLLSLSFFLVVSIAYLFQDEMGGDIHGYTVAVIFGGIFLFHLGEVLVRMFYRGRKRVFFKANKDIVVKDKYLFFMCILVGFALYFGYKHFMNVASSLYGVTNPLLAYGVVRNYYVNISNQVTDVAIRKDIGLILLENAAYTLVFYSFYTYCYTRFFKGSSRTKLLLPFLLGCPIYLFQSGGRMAFLQIATTAASVIFMMIKQTELKGGEPITGFRVYLYKVVKYGVAVIAFFLLLGQVRSGEEEMDFVATLCSYTGSSIIGLDLYLTDYLSHPFNLASEGSWGENTLQPLWNFLNRFGLNIPLNPTNDEFFRYPVGTSNIYSAFKYMISDFSLYGMFLVMFLLGIIYTLFWLRMRYGKMSVYNPLNYYFVSVFFHALLMMPLIYSLPGGVMPSTGLLLKIFFLYLLNKLCMRSVCHKSGRTKLLGKSSY